MSKNISTEGLVDLELGGAPAPKVIEILPNKDAEYEELKKVTRDTILSENNPKDVENLIEKFKRDGISVSRVFSEPIDYGENGSENILGACIGKFVKEGYNLDNLLEISRLMIENSEENFTRVSQKLNALTLAGSLLFTTIESNPNTAKYLVKLIATLIINGADVDNIDLGNGVVELIKGIENTIFTYQIKTAQEFYERVEVLVQNNGKINLTVNSIEQARASTKIKEDPVKNFLLKKLIP